MTKLSESNKRWKKLFIRITNLTRFRVDLKWRMARAGRNRAPGVMLEEYEDYDKL